MVVKNAWDVRNIAKATGAVFAFVVAVSGIFGFAYGQVKNQLAGDFYTRGEAEELSKVVTQTADTVDKLAKSVNANSLNGIKRDIADIQKEMAGLKVDEPNWNQRDRDYYNRLSIILDDLESEKAKIEQQ
jgi:hypothetical protein